MPSCTYIPVAVRFLSRTEESSRLRSAPVGCLAASAGLAGSQDNPTGPLLVGRGDEEEERRAQEEREAREAEAVSGSGSNARVISRTWWGRKAQRVRHGEEPLDGVRNCARALQPLANERATR